MIKRLMIVCFVMMTFSAIAEDKVIEEQGQWSIIEQDHRANPSFLLIFKNNLIRVKFTCNTTYKRTLFSAYYYNVKKLTGTSRASSLFVEIVNMPEQRLFGSIFNNGKESIFFTNNVYYASRAKGYDKEKAKLLPILSQLFKQFLTASGDITFTAQGEGDTVYQATISSDGLPTIFKHFAQYCGPDFVEAFDLGMDEK